MCKYASFGHALFTVRLSDGPMVPGARTLIGVHHAGVTVFDKRKVPSVVHTYNEVVGWQHDRTRVLISLEEEDGTAAQLYMQALPEVCRELCALLQDYNAVFPKKRKVKRTLRTASTADDG